MQTHSSNVVSTPADLRIDGARLWDSHMQLARIGATDKRGVCRLALTELVREARDQFIAWTKEIGRTVPVDAIGNIFAGRTGLHDDLPHKMTGSHLDTQPTGGKFDGNYGVVAGLEVPRLLAEANVQTIAPLEVAMWTNEEGSRFLPVMMGSGVFAGAFTLEHALAAIGYAGEHRKSHAVGAYFEVHIEQGAMLEAHDKVIGVVQGALGLRWYDLTVHGMEAHTGPMALRGDALLVAADPIHALNRIALDHAPHGRSAVGWLDVHPDSRNVIAGRVKFSVDLRAADDASLTVMDLAWRAACAQAGNNGGNAATNATANSASSSLDAPITIDIEQVVYFPSQPFAAQWVAEVRQSAERLGVSSMNAISGAGQDAAYLARVAPSAMIFVPCKDGISHNEIEDARADHLEAGCNVLLQVMPSAASRTGSMRA